MNKVFTDNGWKDYVYWQTEDRKTLKKINTLIEDICRNGNEGIGKPEPLKHRKAWSRWIDFWIPWKVFFKGFIGQIRSRKSF